MTLPTVSMEALMTPTALTYDDLVEAAGLMAERLLSAEGQLEKLTQQLGAAHGEVAALQGVLEFERERTRKRRQGGDRKAAAVTPPACSPSCVAPSGIDLQPGSCPAAQRSSPAHAIAAVHQQARWFCCKVRLQKPNFATEACLCPQCRPVRTARMGDRFQLAICCGSSSRRT